MKRLFTLMIIAAVGIGSGCRTHSVAPPDRGARVTKNAAAQAADDARAAATNDNLNLAIEKLEALIANPTSFNSLKRVARAQIQADLVRFRALRTEQQAALERDGDAAMKDKQYATAATRYQAALALGQTLELDTKLQGAQSAQAEAVARAAAIEAERRAREEAARVAAAEKAARVAAAEEAARVAAAEKAAAEARIAQAEAERTARLAAALLAAKTAAGANHWEEVLQQSETVLTLEPGQAEATALKHEAVVQLRPRLKLIVEAGGQEVAAKISDGATIHLSSFTWELESGTTCLFRIFHQSDWSDFAIARRWKPAELNLTVNWRGLKEQRVLLEEQKDPQPNTPLALELSGGITMDLIWIPPGEFTMGSTEGESDEYPVHTVRITKGFGMGKTEVTQAQWESVMGTKPSYFKGADLPVESVCWNDCQLFLERLNQQLTSRNLSIRACLPTEAEWEYACRAGTITMYHTGPDDSNLRETAWYWGVSVGKTHPVGQKSANHFGLYDMHGNVWEWCQDWHGRYTSDAALDPTGPSSGTNRVSRGGSFVNYSSSCRAARRSGYGPTIMYNITGFRIVVR